MSPEMWILCFCLYLMVLQWSKSVGIVKAFSTSQSPNAKTTGFLDNDSASLSHLLSSPTRYAAALNMTSEHILRTKRAYEEAAENLHQQLASEDLSGPQKHALLCQHRIDYGRQPFVCPRCWSYLPICVCSLVPSDKIALPRNLSVMVWTHHREWGLTSNTGGLLGIMLQDCHVLMKGLPNHDSQLENLIQNPDNLVVVLWPDQEYLHESPENETTNFRRISLEQVQKERQFRHIVLVAVDGTWRNARRMVARLPQSKVFCADLSKEFIQQVVREAGNEQTNATKGGKLQSLLAPLRERGPSISEHHVCTAEAVTGALLQFGINENDAERVLSFARRKVDLVCRYRAKVHRSKKG